MHRKRTRKRIIKSLLLVVVLCVITIPSVLALVPGATAALYREKQTKNVNITVTKPNFTITFNPNGGTVSPTSTTVIGGNTIGTLPTPIKDEYIFDGWYTDLTGGTKITSSYVPTSTQTIYAHWNTAKAQFITGYNLGNRMKKLAGDTDPSVWSVNTSITSIKMATTRPNIANMTSDNIVSINNSTYNAPIYMWFDNGTIYWWSEDKTPELNASASDMFINLRSLQSIPEFSSFDASNVEDMIHMFWENNSLTSIDFSGFASNNNKLTNLAGTFYGCSSLTSLDVHYLKTANVEEMTETFDGCTNLTNLNITGWNTANSTTFKAMFKNCPKLTNIDLSNFNTSKATDMSSMFENDIGLTTLDLTSFKTTLVTDMGYMFRWCTGLTTIHVSDNFVVSQVTSSNQMFLDCLRLVGGYGTVYDSSHIDKAYAHYDGGTTNPGYFDKTATNTYTIVYNANGGTVTTPYVRITRGQAIGTLPTPTKTGYKFDGWYTSSTGGTQISTSYIPTSNQEIYAHWIRINAENISYSDRNTGMNCTDVQCAIDKIAELLR